MQIARALRRGVCRVANPLLALAKLEMRPAPRGGEAAVALPGARAADAGGVSLPRPGVPFGMVVPTVYGPVIVNRHDINQTNALVKTGRAYHHDEIEILCDFLREAPPGAVCLDIGANFGLYALAFARVLGERGGVCHAFEAQRIIAMMAGGTAVLNGVENLHLHHLAVGNDTAAIPIPAYDYNSALNFGSVEFGGAQHEALTQERRGDAEPERVRQVRIDDLGHDKVCLVKIDVEGMEEQVLAGARETIARCRPVVSLEWMKSDKAALVATLKGWDYVVHEWGNDLLAIPAGHESRYPRRPALPVL